VVRGAVFVVPGCLGIRRRAHGRGVVADSSGDVRILTVSRHNEYQVSGGWRGVDRDDEQIDSLIVGTDDSNRAHLSALTQSTATLQPLASRIRRGALSHPGMSGAIRRTGARWAPTASISAASSMARSVERGHHAPS